MRKKTFLKAVSIIACLSILRLSVPLSLPGAIVSERTDNWTSTYNQIMKTATMLLSFLPFLNLNVNDENGSTSSDQTYNDDSSGKIKITGMLTSPKKANRDW